MLRASNASSVRRAKPSLGALGTVPTYRRTIVTIEGATPPLDRGQDQPTVHKHERAIQRTCCLRGCLCVCACLLVGACNVRAAGGGDVVSDLCGILHLACIQRSHPDSDPRLSFPLPLSRHTHTDGRQLHQCVGTLPLLMGLFRHRAGRTPGRSVLLSASTPRQPPHPRAHLCAWTECGAES